MILLFLLIQIKNTHLWIFPGTLDCIFYNVCALHMPDQKRRAGIMLQPVLPDGAAVIVGIAVQTFMSAGVISTDVCAEQAGALTSRPFLLWHLQSAPDGTFQYRLR